MHNATALQRHAAFFDPEGTGEVTMGQTWAGLGRLGVALLWRLLLTPIINGFLGYLTQGKVSVRIAVARIAEGKHPFDSGTFGDDGGAILVAWGEFVRLAGPFSPLGVVRAVGARLPDRLPPPTRR